MEFVKAYLNFWKTWYDLFLWIVAQIEQWYLLAEHAEILPSVEKLIIYPLLIWIYLASAFIATTISEFKGRSRTMHFIGGLIFPVLYPALIQFLPNIRVDFVKEAKEKELDKRHKLSSDLTARMFDNIGEEYTPTTEEEPEVQIEPETAEELASAEAEQAIPTVMEMPLEPESFNRIYFATRATNPDGTPAGPFIISMTDGRVMEASRIVDALDDIVVLEMIGIDGNPRTIRARYDKIADCQLKS